LQVAVAGSLFIGHVRLQQVINALVDEIPTTFIAENVRQLFSDIPQQLYQGPNAAFCRAPVAIQFICGKAVFHGEMRDTLIDKGYA
jgi:hypothetical protein